LGNKAFGDLILKEHTSFKAITQRLPAVTATFKLAPILWMPLH